MGMLKLIIIEFSPTGVMISMRYACPLLPRQPATFGGHVSNQKNWLPLDMKPLPETFLGD